MTVSCHVSLESGVEIEDGFSALVNVNVTGYPVTYQESVVVTICEGAGFFDDEFPEQFAESLAGRMRRKHYVFDDDPKPSLSQALEAFLVDLSSYVTP